MTARPVGQPPDTVADYLARINDVLAAQSGRVRGEVTSIKPYERAIYFTIRDKDKPALLDCLIWPNVYAANGIDLKVGDEIIVTGTPDIYIPNGRFSFKTDTIEYAGEGALKKAYEKLKATLSEEGLLSVERKRMLPEFPKKIGVITSRSGTVIHDFSNNLDRRGYKVSIVDSRVEGKDAIHELLVSIRTMAKQDIEALVIIRGGGSWESLQAFNTESVVRAVSGFKVPVITGIGHDADVTLVEMVADVGRSTPTAVAEILNEPWDGLESLVNLLERKTVGSFRLSLTARINLAEARERGIFQGYARQLSDTGYYINDTSARITRVFAELAKNVHEATSALLRATGMMRSNIHANQRFLRHLPGKLNQQLQISIRAADNKLTTLERTVTANDPKRNMKLGYSLSYVNGKLARKITDISQGETITTHLVDGKFTSEVKGVK